jgi:hypothetical protein
MGAFENENCFDGNQTNLLDKRRNRAKQDIIMIDYPKPQLFLLNMREFEQNLGSAGLIKFKIRMSSCSF